MPLFVGDKLGPYEILAPIGMGEVYRARDTKLDRDVAVKVLPAALACDSERLARFEREAKVLASLNHPNIAQIYGVEESGGSQALVMELVPGQTLKGPLPLEEALRIAAQIADALGAAHEKGITHRDLKPANVMITPEGVVKVLDFGLAAVAPSSADGSHDASNSPTLTLSPTTAGMILGTAAYMAPEQARGQSVDRRADIWAFGVLLHEMLTGRQLFRGDTVSDILASVLKDEPDLERVPAKVRPLLRRCLEKEPKRRLQAIGDWDLLLEDSPRKEARSPAPYWAAIGVLAVALAALALLQFRETPPKQQSYRFQIAPPPNTRFTTFRLSPDGRSVAFIASPGGAEEGGLWIRALDSLESHQVTGSEDSRYPFWSPDSSFVGFFQGGKLKKVAAAGGPAQTICDVVDSRGGAWGPDGTILFTDGPARPIFRVPSAGGKPTPVTKLSGGDPSEGHREPEFLPDGQHFLFSMIGNKPEAIGLRVGSLDGSTPVRLLPDNSDGVYVPGGYIFFLREGTLMALPFDAAGLKATGEAFPVAENVAIAAAGDYGAFSSTGNGTLAYWSGGYVQNGELVWMDRSGKRLGTLGKLPDSYSAFALSPDEKTIAATVGNAPRSDIWLLDSASGSSTRFTFGFTGTNPVWSPDGRSIVYSRPKGVALEIVRRQISGGPEELLLSNATNAFWKDVSSDGKFIVYDMKVAKTGLDLGLLAADGDHRESVYLATAANERRGRFSLDGKWMAYQSDESGQYQVYVQTIPVGAGKFQISTSGGTLPAWGRDGKELYYLAPDQKLMAVPVMTIGSTFVPGTPQALFTAAGASGFAVTRAGQRFLMNVPAGGESAAAGPPLTIVTNWSR